MSNVKISSVIAKNFHSLAHDVMVHGHTHYDLSGGRGSLKSSTISILVCCLIVSNPEIHALVLRKVGNTIRDSVYSQYMWAIDKLGMSGLWESRKTPLELIYKPTVQKIMFRGADDPMKIKSIKAPFGYIAITHFEEKDQFSGRAEIRSILQSTMRGGSVFWNFESYNPPISRQNWANMDTLEDRKDRLCHKSTYLEAPEEWLGDQFLIEADELKRSSERAYRHEYLGEPTGNGGNVFENLTIKKVSDDEIKSFDRIYNGVDWGYYPDPWAFTRCFYIPSQRKLVIFDEKIAYRKGNDETFGILEGCGVTRSDIIIADSADPKSIGDYRRLGLNCRGVAKWRGSVEYTMKWLQSLNEIVIDPERCPNCCKEFLNYEYARTKDGEIVEGYPDKNNHFIDAVRYSMEPIWRKGSQRSDSTYKTLWM